MPAPVRPRREPQHHLAAVPGDRRGGVRLARLAHRERQLPGEEILGPSTPRLTMSVYNRMPSEVLQAAVARLDGVFAPPADESLSDSLSDAKSAG